MTYFIALLRWLGWRTLAVWSLLWFALSVIALQLATALGGLDVGLLWEFTTLALCLSWLCARSRLRTRWSVIVLLALGFGVVGVRVGGLGGKALAVLRAFNTWREMRDVLPFAQAVNDGALAVWTLLARVRDWLWARGTGQFNLDPVAALLFWGLTFWLVAAWAGWVTRRRAQVWAALTPAAALLAFNLWVVGAYPSALLAVLAVGLLLAPLIGHHTRETQWRATGVDYSEEIRFDLAVAVVPLTLCLVLVTAFLSSLSAQDFIVAARDLFGARSGVAIGANGSHSSQPSARSAFDGVRAPGLPRRHLIGSGPELSQQVVLTVKTDESSSLDHVPRYYWRSLTYDRYTGSGWVTDEVDAVTVRAGDAVAIDEMPFRRRVQQDVQFSDEQGGLVHVAGALLSADHEVQVARRSDGDLFGALTTASAYRAQSLVPAVGEATLRAAGNDYPPSVRNRYLTLPADMPPRVLALARDLTATEPTAYDRARSIERYLRALPYTLDLPGPPSSRDVVDYFLFDLQKGYCDYYATAMVVLARAAGLPARLVVGYASGHYESPSEARDAANTRYVVTAADAHSWAEIYFAGVGWIEFEPTGGRPELNHPSDAPTLPNTDARDTHATTRTVSIADVLIGAAWWATGGFALLFVVAAALVARSEWRLRRMASNVVAQEIFGRLCAYARHMAVPLRDGDTPHEIAAKLKQRYEELAPKNQRDTAARAVERDLFALTDAYVRARFSRHPLDEAEGRCAVERWRRMRWRLWRARIKGAEIFIRHY